MNDWVTVFGTGVQDIVCTLITETEVPQIFLKAMKMLAYKQAKALVEYEAQHPAKSGILYESSRQFTEYYVQMKKTDYYEVFLCKRKLVDLDHFIESLRIILNSKEFNDQMEIVLNMDETKPNSLLFM